MTDQPDKVLVRTLEAHTYDGVAYEPGETYEAEAPHVEFLELRKFAERVPLTRHDKADESAPHKAHAKKK